MAKARSPSRGLSPFPVAPGPPSAPSPFVASSHLPALRRAASCSLLVVVHGSVILQSVLFAAPGGAPTVLPTSHTPRVCEHITNGRARPPRRCRSSERGRAMVRALGALAMLLLGSEGLLRVPAPR